MLQKIFNSQGLKFVVQYFIEDYLFNDVDGNSRKSTKNADQVKKAKAVVELQKAKKDEL